MKATPMPPLKIGQKELTLHSGIFRPAKHFIIKHALDSPVPSAIIDPARRSALKERYLPDLDKPRDPWRKYGFLTIEKARSSSGKEPMHADDPSAPTDTSMHDDAVATAFDPKTFVPEITGALRTSRLTGRSHYDARVAAVFAGAIDKAFGKLPDDAVEAAKWYRTVLEEIQRLQLATSSDSDMSTTKRLESYAKDCLLKITKNKIKAALDIWLKKFDTGRISSAEFAQFKHSIPTVLHAAESLLNIDEIKRYFPLHVASRSTPSFLPEGERQRLSKQQIVDRLLRIQSTNEDFVNAVKAGLESYPADLLDLMYRFGGNIRAVDGTMLIPHGGWTSDGKTAFITSSVIGDNGVFSPQRSIFKGTVRDEYRLSTIHECGHILDAQLHQERKIMARSATLSAATSLADYLQQYRKLGKPGTFSWRYQNLEEISGTAEFKKAHKADLALQKNQSIRATPKYFTEKSSAPAETFAEIMTSLFGGNSRIDEAAFPNTFQFVRKLLGQQDQDVK